MTPKDSIASRWPVVRQLANRDGYALRIRRCRNGRRELRPRTNSVDHVRKPICPYCAGCVYIRDKKIIDIEGLSGFADFSRLPLREGASGALWKTAKALTAASLLVALVPGGSRHAPNHEHSRRFGSLCLRFALFHAGKVSARYPRTTFGQQRAGFGGFEVTREPSITGPETKQVPHPVPAPKTREEIWNVPQLTP